MSPWCSFKLGRSLVVGDSAVNYEKKIGGEEGDNLEEVKGTVSSRNGSEFSFGGRELGVGFSGFPLPTPDYSSDDQGCFLGLIRLEFGSGSDSSMSSSGSSDDHARLPLDHAAVRGNEDDRAMTVLRSQGQVSVGTNNATPFLHSHVSTNDFNSPRKKIYDGKGECHRLPLPPGPPYKPYTSTIPRSPPPEDSSSVWRKGKFIRRCSSGPLFLAFNSEFGKMCTIKEVIAFSDDEVSRKCLDLLSQEKTLLSQLSHANIIQYYGFDLRGRKLSVYLEYTSRGSVLQLLQEYGPLGELVIQNYAQQVLSALVYLHGRHIAHRNIRAENIVVSQNGDIRLVDFGMARNITSSSSLPVVKENLHWVAPEVVMNTEAYNLAADIWSLGCTVFEMATSKPPWSQYQGAAAIYKIGKSKDAPEIPDYLSPNARSFIQQCLQRDPSARPTAKQLLKHPFIRNRTTLRERRDPSLSPGAKPMLCHLSIGNKATSRVTDANNMTIEALSQGLNGNHTQSAREIQSNRIGTSSVQQSGKMNCSYASKSTVPTTLIATRGSPGTSLSPHSSNTIDAKSSVRPNTRRSTCDPLLYVPQCGAGTHLIRSPTRTLS